MKPVRALYKTTLHALAALACACAVSCGAAGALRAETGQPAPKAAIPPDALLAVKNGRVQLYSVSRLTEDDMRNPFEIRVQVAVEMLETVFDIGGIIEGKSPAENTAILLFSPPSTRKPAPGENGAKAGAGAPKNTTAGKPDAKKTSLVCSIGDVVQGFRIHDINRDGIVIEQAGKFVQVPRGAPVTVCVPLTNR